jgi:hypothetical protein
MEDSQWNKRLSLLNHRYMREYGIAREDEIIEKAWRTLELFCVGKEARKSLQVRRNDISPSSALRRCGIIWLRKHESSRARLRPDSLGITMSTQTPQISMLVLKCLRSTISTPTPPSSRLACDLFTSNSVFRHSSRPFSLCQRLRGNSRQGVLLLIDHRPGSVFRLSWMTLSICHTRTSLCSHNRPAWTH